MEHLMEESNTDFTGDNYEQEDDITLLEIKRDEMPEIIDAHMSILKEFDIPSQRGNERQAVDQVLDAMKDLYLPESRRKRLETAVAEATMNAMEHGNQYRADLPVHITVLCSPDRLSVRITDHGGGESIPETETPDLDAKLAGLQSPRGWGFFLIKNMVDEMNVSSDNEHHVIELMLNLQEG